MVVTITFNNFSTESCCDHVRIYDGLNYNSDTIAELSGTYVDLSDMSFSSTQQFMYIYFTSDSSVVSNGFSATFQSIGKENFIVTF